MKMKGAIWRRCALHIAVTMMLCAAGTAAQDSLVREGPLYASEYYTPIDLSSYSPYYQTLQEDRMYRDDSDEYPRNDESAYQQYSMEYPDRFGNRPLQKVLSEYLEDSSPPSKELSNDGIKKRMLSLFRERTEREKSKEEQDKLADMFLQKLQQDVVDDSEAEADVDDSFHRDEDHERNYMENRDYMEMIQELWDKYKGTHHNREREPSVFAFPTSSVFSAVKRQLPADYSTLGWSGVGFRKRSNTNALDESDTGTQNDGLFFLNYPATHKELVNNDNSRVRSRYRWLKPADFDNHFQGGYSPDYMYAQSKRFPVAKRSSNFYAPSGTFVHHKRAANGRELTFKKAMRNDSASGTDPKVVKDLSNLFGNKGLNMEKVSTSLPIKAKKDLDKNNKRVNKKNVTHTDGHTSKENGPTEIIKHKHQVEEVSLNQANDEPLKIRKKSIDWSNYFGIDRRRKKSESYGNKNDINNDWMIKRYNQAVAMAVKRSSGSQYPLNYFRDNYVSEAGSLYGNDEAQSKRKTQFRNSDASNLDEMDDKLKNIEDLIIDEALKYTGAHEGETDPKEIQEVKDKVISRLAAAYSLEKMRRALSEFKTSLAVQRHALKAKENVGTDGEPQQMDDKDAALDKSKRPVMEAKATNKELNSLGATECDTLIERRCRSGVAGERSSLFFSLCKWHQMCYLCSSNNNPESLTNCDVMFLSEAQELCHGDVVCQWTARPVVEYLRNVHDTTPTELGTRCQGIVCDGEASTDIDPESDANANKIHRR